MQIKKLIPAVLIAGIAMTALAQDATSAPAANGRMIHRVERRLGITAAQREQVKAILKNEQPALEALHTSLKAERAEMLPGGSFNEAQVRATAAKYAQINTDTVVEHAKLRSELLAVLTPEQREKVEALRARFGAVIDDRLETLGDSL